MPRPVTEAHVPQRELTLRDFDYPFPERLVAQEPRADRDRARLCVRHADGRVSDSQVIDLTSELPAGSLLILNETKVFPSRLRGRLATGGEVELFLLDPQEGGTWRALGRPLKKLKPGTIVQLPAGVSARVVAKSEDGAGTAFVELSFNRTPEQFSQWLDQHAYIPLPPYIKRDDPAPAARSPDRDRYQTVYAEHRGSVAAPTAGLHLTPTLLRDLEAKGVEIRRVCLHVGAGTFLPVKTDDVSQHKMHAERYRVGQETARALRAAKNAGRLVVAVGTTTLRSLESLYRRAGNDPEQMIAIADSWATTELFLRPRTLDDRYRPWVIDGLLTNFHQPCSTLFMLVSALIGVDEAKALYAQAIAKEYRLYSYGDASLLWLP